MTSDSSDDPSPSEAGGNVDESAVARLVGRYSGPGEAVSEDDLRDALERTVRGTVATLEPAAVGLTVVVERPSSDGDDVVRDAYAVRRVTGLDGDPALDWTYLGPAD
ncbi:MAG: hypothetical protein ABEJ40_10625 [Haloarculaceae archaeon]